MCLGNRDTAVTVTRVMEAYSWLRHFFENELSFENDASKAFQCSGKCYAILSCGTLPLKVEKQI